MNLKQLIGVRQELTGLVNHFKHYLGRSERIHWCEMYIAGLLLDGERKSIQPMAARLPGGNEQALQQFINQSPWHHEEMQLQLAYYLANQLKMKKGVLVLDDTSLAKKVIILLTSLGSIAVL